MEGHGGAFSTDGICKEMSGICSTDGIWKGMGENVAWME
jgi:hypothetical protein